MVLLTIISTYGTYYVTVNAINHDLCNLYRTAILIWFYHFGIFYRKYMEKWFAKCSGYIVCGICLVFIALFNGVCGFNEFYFNSLTWNQPGVECCWGAWWIETNCNRCHWHCILVKNITNTGSGSGGK